MCLSMAFFTATITLCGKDFNPAELPRQIRAMYGNYNMAHDDVAEFKDLFISMQKAGFNLCDLKINGMGIQSVPAIEENLKKLADEINRHQMVFTVYTYPIPHKSWEQVDFLNYNEWRRILKNAFILAEVSKRIPIVAMKLDLEELGLYRFKIPYDDKTWTEFASSHKITSNVPLSERHKFLVGLNMEKQYNEWIEQKLCDIVVQFRKEIHAINPKLHLGMMPGYDEILYRAFMRELSTPSVPAIIDNWSLYTGCGYSKATTDAVALTKKLNSNNLAISWFRINAYPPESALSSHIYHAACMGDGYSTWEFSMLAKPGSKLASSDEVYHLPSGQTPEKYWQAYGKANWALMADIKEKTTARAERLPLEPITAGLDTDDIEIPHLIPAGNGSGEPKMLIMRERQIIYFYGIAGRGIRFEIAHNARRSISVQYKILDSNKKILRHGILAQGTQADFSVALPQTGIGVLAITGGDAGLAWYEVKIHSKHIGIATTPQRAYLFGFPFTVYASPINGTLRIKTDKGESAIVKVNDTPGVTITGMAPLILPHTEKISKIEINQSKLPGTYTQDIYFESDAKSPVFLSDGPQRLLKTK